MNADGRSDVLLHAADLTLHYPLARGAVLRAVDGVSLRVRRGETFGIIGESGSGKSTLGRVLAGVAQPTGGTLRVAGTDPAGAPRSSLPRRLMIHQDPDAALDPRMTVLQSVREPLDIKGGAPRAERNRATMALLGRVGLGVDHAVRYPHELSGGQKQRVNIARALTVRPDVVVCDEIVSALDVSIQADVLNLLAELQVEFGLTYVFISHNLSVVAHVSDQVAVMYLGRFVEVGAPHRLLHHPKHPYTAALLSAEPVPLPSELRSGRRVILQGEMPSPVSPPSGCRFRTRCPMAQEVCAAIEPPWRPGTGDEHVVACHFAQ